MPMCEVPGQSHLGAKDGTYSGVARLTGCRGQSHSVARLLLRNRSKSDEIDNGEALVG